MAEISNTSSSAQVEALRPATTAEPTASTAPTSPVAASSAAATSLVVDVDPVDPLTAVPESAPINVGLDDATDGAPDPLAQAASALEDLLPNAEFPPNTTLRIEQDADSGRFIYMSVDNDTGEVVRQFPPEDFLEILSTFREPEGVVIDDLA